MITLPGGPVQALFHFGLRPSELPDLGLIETNLPQFPVITSKQSDDVTLEADQQA
ncbi:hypothetical protein D3C79_665400 [compost metagenome]